MALIAPPRSDGVHETRIAFSLICAVCVVLTRCNVPRLEGRAGLPSPPRVGVSTIASPTLITGFDLDDCKSTLTVRLEAGIPEAPHAANSLSFYCLSLAPIPPVKTSSSLGHV